MLRCLWAAHCCSVSAKFAILNSFILMSIVPQLQTKQPTGTIRAHRIRLSAAVLFCLKRARFPMARPVTLFTGQWADLPLADLARRASEFGYQGLELACWGDHFEVDKALSEDGYCAARRDLLEGHDLQVHAISTHLVGQAVLDTID